MRKTETEASQPPLFRRPRLRFPDAPQRLVRKNEVEPTFPTPAGASAGRPLRL